MSQYIKETISIFHNIIDKSRHRSMALSAFLIPEPVMAELNLAMDCCYGDGFATGHDLDVMQRKKNSTAFRMFGDVPLIPVPNMIHIHGVMNGHVLPLPQIVEWFARDGVKDYDEHSGRLGKETDQTYLENK